MSSRVAPRLLRTLAALALLFTFLFPARPSVRSVYASPAYQSLPFSQDWSNSAAISIDDNWDSVPGFVGYRGDDLTGSTGTNPQTILADGSGTPIDVNADETSPGTFNTGGVAEFALANPVVALQGSSTADAPHLVLHLNTVGFTSIQVRYTVRDVDDGGDHAQQPIALHYRVGESGDFSDVSQAYRADLSSGPDLTLSTPFTITLPSAVNNQPQLQLRWMTANAGGSDEWLGIDDISVTGTPTGGDAPPFVETITPAPNAVGIDPATAITVAFSEAVDLGATAATLICGGNPVTFSGLPANDVTSVNLMPGADLPIGAACTVTLDPAQISDNDGTADQLVGTTSFNFSVSGGCNDPVVKLSTIQGSGAATPCGGETVVVEAVVIGDYEGADNSGTLRGFYLQEEPADWDSDPATSEGIFVYSPNDPDAVALGDRVRVSGMVSEFEDQTQITETAIEILASDVSVAPVTVSFPLSSVDVLERFEGMLVTFPETLYVTEHFNLDRFGQITLSSGGRLFQPTHLTAPGAAATALQASNDLNRIIVDDALQVQNPEPIAFGRGGNPLTADNTLRGGDTITGLQGVLTYTWGGNSASPSAFRVRPINALGGGVPDFQPANPRPAAPEAVGGELKVASFNLLNYFNTFSGCTGGVGGASIGCRGAENSAEFQRQRAKTIAALVGLDADIIGVIELENDGYNTNPNPLLNAAIWDLLFGLNDATPGDANDYTFIIPDAELNQVNVLGTDAIKVGILYRYNKVEAVNEGTFTSSDSIFERRPLVQVFAQLDNEFNPTGERFAVAVNHFKSKGSCPGSGDPNADQGDGQSCWNARRVQQATALLSLINASVLPSAAMDGDRDVLIMGDLNSYAQEDPITLLQNAGYIDLIAEEDGAAGYSYAFDGQWGYLDYALASPSMALQVTGATEWHINADEPDALDYNTNFRSATQQTTLYAPDAYRASDHDPILIGLDLAPPPANQAPTLSTIDPFSGATRNQPFTLTYADLAAAADAQDPDGDPLVFRIEQVLDGSLTKDGTPITPGVTTLGVGEELVYTPATSGSNVSAFSVVASDGSLASTPAVAVRFVVAEPGSSNQAPTLTAVDLIGGAAIGEPFTLTYGTLAAAANEQDPDGDPLVFRIEALLDGSLTKDGTAVTPGATSIGAGETLVYTPASSGSAVAAFRIVAADGSLASAPPVDVRFVVAEVAPPNQAPTLSAIDLINGATISQPFTITYGVLLAAANEQDPDGDPLVFQIEQVLDGSLTKDGIAVTPGTTLGPGEELVYTPATSGSNVSAFSVVVFDGVLSSVAPVAVRFAVTDPGEPEPSQQRLYLPLLENNP
ncbi:MAG: ExeM/NucH family extracellular endonuclease [Oscillochloris sp.]|nr:ExeM/NucH family extracellular endonuclease [Oscillochloris sp.]